MAKKQVTPSDRWMSHIIVGIGVGVIVGQKTGLAGFVAAAVLAALAHEALDAPVADLVAEIT